MEEEKKELPPESVGLARFHKITIGAGVLLMGFLVWRYWRQYQQSESPQHLVYLLVSASFLIGLAVYLWRFSKNRL